MKKYSILKKVCEKKGITAATDKVEKWYPDTKYFVYSSSGISLHPNYNLEQDIEVYRKGSNKIIFKAVIHFN